MLNTPPTRAVLASFTTRADVRALDLTQLPATPSVFEEDEFDTREAILFLESFIDAITEPVTKDGREHIDYVPSQVVSEFFAQVFRTESKEQLDAVIYPSAVMPDGRNLVLFPLRQFDRRWKDVVDVTLIRVLEVPDWPTLQALLRQGDEKGIDFPDK